MRKFRLGAGLLMLMTLFALGWSIPRAQAQSCASIVSDAVSRALLRCQGLSPDTICKANDRVETLFLDGNVLGRVPVSIRDLNTLTTYGATATSGLWGIARSRIGEDLILLAFGSIEAQQENLRDTGRSYTIRQPQVTDPTRCEEIPSGIVVATASGRRGFIIVNDVQIELGSTALITLHNDNAIMRIANLGGTVVATVGTATVSIPEGYQLDVTMAYDRPAALPSAPVPAPPVNALIFDILGQMVVGITASVDTGFPPLEVQFASQVQPASASGLSYQWDFGAELSDTSANPSYTFFAPGEYVVGLTVGADGLEAGHATRTIVVQTPSADFSFTPETGRAPLTVQFTDLSQGNFDTYRWNFGDDTISAERNPAHTYTEAGSYTVTLEASGPSGSYSASRQITVELSPPDTRFTVTTDNLTATFANQTVGAATYRWEFGDGTTSTQANPTHIYAQAGSYVVTLTATGAGGDTATSQTITVASPLPDLTIDIVGNPDVRCDFGLNKRLEKQGQTLPCTLTVNMLISNRSVTTVTTGFAVTLTGDAVPDETQILSGIAAGASVPLQMTLGPGGNCYNPDCTVTATVDSRGNVAETNENNNSVSRTFTG